jgi:hypothetical protein
MSQDPIHLVAHSLTPHSISEFWGSKKHSSKTTYGIPNPDFIDEETKAQRGEFHWSKATQHPGNKVGTGMLPSGSWVTKPKCTTHLSQL